VRRGFCEFADVSSLAPVVKAALRGREFGFDEFFGDGGRNLLDKEALMRSLAACSERGDEFFSGVVPLSP